MPKSINNSNNGSEPDAGPDKLDRLIARHLNITLKDSLPHWTVKLGYCLLLLVLLYAIILVVWHNLPTGDPLKTISASVTVYALFAIARVCIKRLAIEQYEYRYNRLLLLIALVTADHLQTDMVKQCRIAALENLLKELKNRAPRTFEPEQYYQGSLDYLLLKLNSFRNKPKED